MRNRSRWFLPMLLAVACLYTYRLDEPKTHTYSADGISGLSAATSNGGIHVMASGVTAITVVESAYAYGRNRADAEKAIANVVYRDTIVGTNLLVSESLPGGARPYGASFAISVPESIRLWLATTNGDISVAPDTGVPFLIGDINAATTNGRVDLARTVGMASVSTTNGAVNVEFHDGAFYGATTNGAVNCDISALGPTEDIGLATTNGAVTLLLPADVSARIDATTTNATVTIYDFTVVYEEQAEHHIRGRIGSGASEVTITTTNAPVVIRRRS